MSLHEKKKGTPHQIKPTTTTLRMWNGAKVTQIEKVSLSVSAPDGH